MNKNYCSEHRCYYRSEGCPGCGQKQRAQTTFHQLQVAVTKNGTLKAQNEALKADNIRLAVDIEKLKDQVCRYRIAVDDAIRNTDLDLSVSDDIVAESGGGGKGVGDDICITQGPAAHIHGSLGMLTICDLDKRSVEVASDSRQITCPECRLNGKGSNR